MPKVVVTEISPDGSSFPDMVLEQGTFSELESALRAEWDRTASEEYSNRAVRKWCVEAYKNDYPTEEAPSNGATRFTFDVDNGNGWTDRYTYTP